MKYKKKDNADFGYENNCHGLEKWQVENLMAGMEVQLDSVPATLKNKIEKCESKRSKK
jgi:hypothetical protein|tara:strand:- start:1507 stop:1680 length:174 start_codon:yes stop_codon:yes gene_type:complete